MSLHLFQGKSVILIPCFRVREANSVPCWALHTGMVHDYFMVRISLVRRYHYLNVNDLYCKWTDTSIWGVRHNKDTVTVIWENPPSSPNQYLSRFTTEPAWQVRNGKGRTFRAQIPFLFPFER